MVRTRIACMAIAALIAGTAAAFAPLQARAAAPLRVCADPDYMPYSNRAGDGFENKIAQTVAHTLGRPLVYVWKSIRGDTGFEEMIHKDLNAGKCDLVVDLPYADSEVQTTHPYYISSYVFVYKKGSHADITSLDSPALHHVKIGYEADTPVEMGLKMRALTIGAKPFLTADQEDAAPARVGQRRSSRYDRYRPFVGSRDRLLRRAASRSDHRNHSEHAQPRSARTIHVPDGDGRARGKHHVSGCTQSRAGAGQIADLRDLCGPITSLFSNRTETDEQPGKNWYRRRRPDGREHGPAAQGRRLYRFGRL